MHTTRETTTTGLPPGWAVETRRPRFLIRDRDFALPIGWVVEGVFYLALAPVHVRAEADEFPTNLPMSKVVIKRWSFLKRRTVRWVSNATHDAETIPRSEWLDEQFEAGPPDDVLHDRDHGHPIALRYHSGRPGDRTVDLEGYLRKSAWTSLGMTVRSYDIDHDLPGQDASRTHLSEFGLVWDARYL